MSSTLLSPQFKFVFEFRHFIFQLEDSCQTEFTEQVEDVTKVGHPLCLVLCCQCLLFAVKERLKSLGWR